MDQIWKIVTWSLQSLWEGRWPTTDPWGQAFPRESFQARFAGAELAEGFRCFVYSVQADLDFFL